MEIYHLLKIGYKRDMDTEDAEILDIIQILDYEIKKKEMMEINRNIKR